MSDSECLTVDSKRTQQVLPEVVFEEFEIIRGPGMDKAEFDKLLPTLPREEHKAFLEWFVEYLALRQVEA